MMKYLLILSLLWMNLSHADTKAAEDNTLIIVEESNQLLDPFNRGVNRPSRFDSNRIEDDLYTNSRFDDIRSLNDHRYYRVASIDETNVFKAKIKSDVKKPSGGSVDAHYIHLMSNSVKNTLLRHGKKIIMGYGDLLARNISVVSANSATGFSLVYGPFKTPQLALSHCHFYVYATRSKAIDCKKSLVEKPTSDREIRKFYSNAEANIGLSQAGIMYFSGSEMQFKTSDLIAMNIAVSEDQPLGPKGYWITKIHGLGIYVASIYGDIAMIPMHSIPVNDEVNAGSSIKGLGDSPTTSSSNQPESVDNKLNQGSQDDTFYRDRIKEKILSKDVN